MNTTTNMRALAMSCLLGSLGVGAGCLTDIDLGGFDDGSDGSGSTSPSASLSTGQASSSPSGGDASASASGTNVTTGSESSGSAGPVGVCGDGTEDPGEQCDDGNRQDADGCNTDCVISGSLLWQSSIESLNLIAIGPDDVVHAFRVRDDQTATLLSRYTIAGDLIGVDVAPILGQGFVTSTLNQLRVLDDGMPIASATLEREKSIMEHTFQGQRDGWVYQSPDGGLVFDRLDDGTLLCIRGHVPEDAVFQRLGSDGEVQFEVAVDAGRRVFRGPGRTLVSQQSTGELVLLDTEGEPLWSAPIPGTLRGGGVTPEGELLVAGTVDETFPRRVFAGRWSAEGALLDMVTWPDEPADVQISNATVDGEGNLVVGMTTSVVKFSPELEVWWQQGATVWDLAVDSSGAVVVSDYDTLSKYAP